MNTDTLLNKEAIEKNIEALRQVRLEEEAFGMDHTFVDTAIKVWQERLAELEAQAKRYTIEFSIKEVDASGDTFGPELDGVTLDYAMTDQDRMVGLMGYWFNLANGGMEDMYDEGDQSISPRCPEIEPGMQQDDQGVQAGHEYQASPIGTARSASGAISLQFHMLGDGSVLIAISRCGERSLIVFSGSVGLIKYLERYMGEVTEWEGDPVRDEWASTQWLVQAALGLEEKVTA
jgi:hypothetical protein